MFAVNASRIFKLREQKAHGDHNKALTTDVALVLSKRCCWDCWGIMEQLFDLTSQRHVVVKAVCAKHLVVNAHAHVNVHACTSAL